MSCDYCTSGKNMMRGGWSYVSVDKDDDVYCIYYSDGYHEVPQIRFGFVLCAESGPQRSSKTA